MKDFFKTFFASLLALAVAGGLAFLLFFGVLAVIGASSKPTVPNRAILVFDLNTSLVDGQPAPDPGQALDAVLSGNGAPTQSLPAAIDALDRAATDDRIAALFLTGNLRSAGPAQLTELRAAIQRFKAKKPVIAYNMNWGKREYYLAAGASTVYVNPVGSVAADGYASEPMYFGDAFKKYGVEVQVTRVGKYKSAVEPYILDKMSDADREQVQKLLDDLWGDWKTSVAKDRHITPEAIQALADTKGTLEADEALQAHLVDKVAPYDVVLDALKALAGRGPKDREFPQIALSTYAGIPDGVRRGRNRIAVLVAEGEIVDGEGRPGQVGGDSFSRALRRLRLDPSVKAVVLRVDSPGGSVAASELIQREVILTRKVKPVVVSMGHLAASGGYWISTYGDRIFAEPGTITGSIGVFGMLPNVKKLANDHGITWDSVQTARMADVMTLTRPKTDFELARIQDTVDHIYDLFVTKVADSRKLSKAAVEAIAQGRVWSGQEALKLGLVDQIGGLGSAERYAAKLAKVGDDYYVSGPDVAPDPFRDLLVRLLQGKPREVAKTGPVGVLVGDFKRQFALLSSLNDPQGVYARLPYDLDLR